jgi:coenzyme F420-reducing hydrogenase beta subunit
VQAQVGDTYEKVKSFLRDGLWVMFSGTPCQIAGLKRYLRKDYEKLLTVDIACHGVPSPKVWNKYIDELQEKNGKIQSINFRSKYKGWKNFMFSPVFDY